MIFSVVAATCAFVISYGTYHNQFMDTRRPMRLALQTAFATLLFFLIATAALPWIFTMLRFGRP